jgi:hypothetical protein
MEAEMGYATSVLIMFALCVADIIWQAKRRDS